MSRNKNLFTLIGFLLILIGFMALILSLVGLQFSFLTWIDKPGRMFGFVAKLLFIVAGFVIVYLAQTDFEGEE